MWLLLVWGALILTTGTSISWDQLQVKDDVLTEPICDPLVPKCCLPTPLYRIAATYEPTIITVFEQYRQLLRNQFSFQDLFHGHLIIDTQGELLMLLHAFEYPSLDSCGAPLGFCQQGSTVDATDSRFADRNYLYHFQSASGKVVTCANPFFTCYGEDFGTEIAEVFYLPPRLPRVYASPGRT